MLFLDRRLFVLFAIFDYRLQTASTTDASARIAILQHLCLLDLRLHQGLLAERAGRTAMRCDRPHISCPHLPSPAARPHKEPKNDEILTTLIDLNLYFTLLSSVDAEPATRFPLAAWSRTRIHTCITFK